MSGDFPDELRYTASDEWVRHDRDQFVCGITSFASEQLGDVVYVQLPEVGAEFAAGASLGEIESVKAVSELYSPIAGEVLSVNHELDQNPGLINEDPYGKGWMYALRAETPTDFDSLLDAAAYQENTAERA